MSGDINITRYDELLRRVLQVKASPIAGQVSPELVPTFEVQNGSAPEMRLLRGESAWAHTRDVTPNAVAARVILNNPGGSNTLAILDYVEVHTFRIAGLQFNAIVLNRNPTAPAPESGVELDVRQRNSPDNAARSVCSTGIELDASAVGAGYAVIPVTGAGDGEGNIQHFRYDLGAVLLPGFGINVHLTNSSALGRMIVNFRWRERRLEKSEVMLPISLP